MQEEKIIRLTNALYKVTGLFPKEEPLKFAIRKEALDILFFSNIANGKSVLIATDKREEATKKVFTKIELLKTYFSIAKEQGWTDSENFLILEEQYNLFKESFSPKIEKKEEKKEVVKEEKPLIKKEIKKSRSINYEELSAVQLKVLEMLQNRGQLKPNQICDFFPETNPRTIRRELKGLKDLKILLTTGGGKTITYEINQSY
ncbi:MAG: hypothetical protein PHI91_02695 [Candidatus Pacebacteria bacterium]|nr:hypothetical protein [Candidatus Paceibacterota bacterium]MDD2757585.1 hypothetical protein [Candidatus Paceibacterota bacterium]MDD3283949.1 hypothetical protein [Candidatus Paceibacterota bacterium]MDD3970074.1 hypothetical protein [Candidatus Paceibacterota bacterium]MDD4738157.1 hypothetical protein [Candidatus Paceibacterota bacterium]